MTGWAVGCLTLHDWRLLRERFHPGEIHLSSKDSKTVWGKGPNSANHQFRTNTVKQKVRVKVISRSRTTKRTDVRFMSKRYKGRKSVRTKGSHGREWTTAALTKEAEYVTLQN